MKQQEFFGVKKNSDKHLYVRRGDNNEVLITRTQNEQVVEETETIHLDYDEAKKLGIQLLKLANDTLPESGIELKASHLVDSITICQGVNPDETLSNTAYIAIDESDEAKQLRENNGLEPGFSIEGEPLEKLISALAKIV